MVETEVCLYAFCSLFSQFLEHWGEIQRFQRSPWNTSVLPRVHDLGATNHTLTPCPLQFWPCRPTASFFASCGLSPGEGAPWRTERGVGVGSPLVGSGAQEPQVLLTDHQRRDSSGQAAHLLWTLGKSLTIPGPWN